jgi:hypothetical protein
MTPQTPPTFNQPVLLSDSIAQEACVLHDLLVSYGLKVDGVGYDSAEKTLVFPNVGAGQSAILLCNQKQGRVWLSQTTYKGVEGVAAKVHFGARSAESQAA